MREKLEAKLAKRIGRKAITNDDMQTGIITNYVVESTGCRDCPYIVKYLLSFGEGLNARLRLVEESKVVRLKECNK